MKDFLLVLLLIVIVIPTNSAQETTYVLDSSTLTNTELDLYQYSQVIIRNSVLDNVSINVNSVPEVIIRDNQFVNPPKIPVTIWRSNNAQIIGNNFTAVPETAIQIFDSNRPVIRDNMIEMVTVNNDPWAIIKGMSVERSPQAQISGNDISAPLSDGLLVFYSPHSVISNNTIHDSGFSGLAITSSENISVTNNVITSSSSYAKGKADIPPSSAMVVTDSADAVLRENLIDFSDNVGLEVIRSPRSLIELNQISRHPLGIFIGLSGGIVLRDNVFNNNGKNIEIDQATVTVVSSENGHPVTNVISASSTEETSWMGWFGFFLFPILIRRH